MDLAGEKRPRGTVRSDSALATATIFSKRDSHISFKTTVRLNAEIFTICVPVAVPISFYLITQEFSRSRPTLATLAMGILRETK